MAKVMPSGEREGTFTHPDITTMQEAYRLKDKNAQVKVMNVMFDNVNLLDMHQNILKYMHSETKHNLFIVTANPEIVHYASENPKYHKMIEQADYIVPDGTGIVKAARILGQPLQERVPGIEVMETCLNIADLEHKKCFYLVQHHLSLKKRQDVSNDNFQILKFKHTMVL